MEPKSPAKKAGEKMTALESSLAPLFEKTPHLPRNIHDVIVKIAPWLALIFGMLGLLGTISAFLFLPTLSGYMHAGGIGSNSQIILLILLIMSGISFLLNIMAFKPLDKHEKRGWNLIFYALSLSGIVSIVQLAFGLGSIMGLVWLLVGYWLLFEIRRYYH